MQSLRGMEGRIGERERKNRREEGSLLGLEGQLRGRLGKGDLKKERYSMREMGGEREAE